MFVLNGYFSTPVTNQVYTVSPSSAQTKTVSTTAAPSQGVVTYTVSGLPTGNVDIALFPSSGPNAPAVSSSGSVTFTAPGGSSPTAGQAQGQGTTNDGTAGAYIASVNGVPTAGATTTNVKDVSATNGSLSFVLNSSVVDDTIPVVFTEPSTANNDQLMVNADGTPATGYAVGVGGDTTWVAAAAAAAAAGTYNGYVVTSVDTANTTFQACAAVAPVAPATYATPSTSCNTFTYGNAGSSYLYPDGTPLSQSQFSTFLSPYMPNATQPNSTTAAPVAGDELNIGATTGYSPAAATGFQFVTVNGDVPAAPTGVTATYSSTAGGTSTPGNTVTWTPPANLDVSGSQALSGTPAYYTVYRSTVGSNGTPGTVTDLGNVTVTSTNISSPKFVDTNVVAGQSYVYYVTATSSTDGATQTQQTGPYSAGSSAVTSGAGPSAALMKSVAITPSSCTPSADCSGPSATAPTVTGGVATITYNENVSCLSAAGSDFSYSNSQGAATKGTSCSGTSSTTLVVPLSTITTTYSGTTPTYTYTPVYAPANGDTFTYTEPATPTTANAVYAGQTTSPVYAASQTLTSSGPTPSSTNPVATAAALSFVSSSASASAVTGGLITITYNVPVNCASVLAADYTVDSPNGTADVPSHVGCVGSGTTSDQVALGGFATALVSGNTYTVTSTGTGPDSTGGIPQAAGQTTSGTVGT